MSKKLNRSNAAHERLGRKYFSLFQKTKNRKFFIFSCYHMDVLHYQGKLGRRLTLPERKKVFKGASFDIGANQRRNLSK